MENLDIQRQAEVCNWVFISIFFLQKFGGSGKTFTYNFLQAKDRVTGGIALAVASSGIAALLLEGPLIQGSKFQLLYTRNFMNHLSTTCLANLIRNTALIVWDDVLHNYRHSQCLPVVSKGTRGQIVNANANINMEFQNPYYFIS